jgi:hypothetical protein
MKDMNSLIGIKRASLVNRSLSLTLKVLFVLSVYAVFFIGTSTEASAKTIPTKCTNSKSDAAMINAAIENSNPGDEIAFQGPCLINQTIKLLPQRTYRGGDRTGTVLKQANNANLQAVLASAGYLNNTTSTDFGITVRSFTIDGNSAGNAALTAGIALRSWQSTITDLYITDMSGSGIKLTNLSANGTPLMNTTQVNGSITGNFIENSGMYGVYVQDTGNANTDWFLTDNWIGGAGKDGVHMDNAAGWFVERNHIYDIPGDAIYANRMFGTTIADNYIEDFGRPSALGEPSGSGPFYGIYATVQGDADNTISGNRINMFGGEEKVLTYVYIGIGKVNYGIGVINVNGNVIRGSAEATPAKGVGLYYNGGSYPLKVLSSGNLVSNLSTTMKLGKNVILSRTLTVTCRTKESNRGHSHHGGFYRHRYKGNKYLRPCGRRHLPGMQ